MNKVHYLAFVAILSIANISHAKNLVLAASTVKCGGYVSLEVSQETILSLNVNLARGSDCKNLQIDSQGINENLKSIKTEIALNPRQVGTVLPIEINDEVIVLSLSSSDIQQKLTQSHSKEQLEEIAQQQKEIDRRNKNSNTAGVAAVGSAVVIGGAAIAVSEAASSER